MADMEISQEVVDFFENLNNDTPTEEPSAEVTQENATEEAPVAVETTEEDAPTDPVDEAPEPTEEEPGEEQPTSETEVNWEDRYKNLQSQKDREVAAVQQQLEQLQTWAQQQYQWQQQIVAENQQRAQQQAQAQQTSVSREQVDTALDTDPLGTFRWVAFNRPDLMPNVISMVRGKEQLGNEMADAMQNEWFAFQQAQQQQQFQQQLEAQQQAVAAQQIPQQVEGTMSQILGALEQRHGDAFTALSDEIAEKATENAPAFQQYMQQNGLEITPQSVADFITQIYLDVREEKLNWKAQQPVGPTKLTPQQHVENPGAQRQRETTPDEDAMNELLQGARSLGIDVAAPASA